jgi:hypothetical protein
MRAIRRRKFARQCQRDWPVMPSTQESEFELVSHWRVPGDIEAVFECLRGPQIARWWPEAYREVHEISPGGADGCGLVLDILTRGRIPYALRWRLQVVEIHRPKRVAIRASGDLVGSGLWELRQNGPAVEMTYTWRVEAAKPWMRRLAPVLRPLFAANHRWVMRRGEIGLRRELECLAGTARS